jgi:hypothetical protein
MFSPVFEQEHFVPSKVVSQPGQLPYHVFADVLEQFHVAVYDNGFVSSFD